MSRPTPDLTTRLKRIATAVLVLGAFGAFVVVKTWNTFFHYVRDGEMLIIISKTGDALPAGELLASEGQQGPLRQVRGEGRHFVMPFFNEVKIESLADLNMEIEPGFIGIVTARVGTDLRPGHILAEKGEKGIQREVLPPGRHRLNPFGYKVDKKPATEIQPGFVGFVISLVGNEPTRYHVTLDEQVRKDEARRAAVAEAVRKVGGVSDLDATRIDAGVLLVGLAQPEGAKGEVESKMGAIPGVVAVRGPFAGPGQKGIRHDTLQPGLYYLNPYELQVRQVEVGMNQVSFLGADEIAFPSSDAFDIHLDATVEWELHPDNVAMVMAEFGARKEIEDKVLTAQSRSIGRLEGSKWPAKEFLLGEGRSQIQTALTARLLEKCREKHVTVHSAYIRHITIPKELLEPIRESYVAQEIERTNHVQEETQKSEAALKREQKLVEQRAAEVTAETRALELNLGAQATREVAEIEAQTRRTIAEKQLEIAGLEARRTKLLGEAQAQVQRMMGEARAGLFKLKVAAFKGDSDAFARFTLAQSISEDLQIRLVETGQGTFWTDLDKTAGPMLGPVLDEAKRSQEPPAKR